MREHVPSQLSFCHTRPEWAVLPQFVLYTASTLICASDPHNPAASDGRIRRETASVTASGRRRCPVAGRQCVTGVVSLCDRALVSCDCVSAVREIGVPNSSSRLSRTPPPCLFLLVLLSLLVLPSLLPVPVLDARYRLSLVVLLRCWSNYERAR